MLQAHSRGPYPRDLQLPPSAEIQQHPEGDCGHWAWIDPHLRWATAVRGHVPAVVAISEWDAGPQPSSWKKESCRPWLVGIRRYLQLKPCVACAKEEIEYDFQSAKAESGKLSNYSVGWSCWPEMKTLSGSGVLESNLYAFRRGSGTGVDEKLLMLWDCLRWHTSEIGHGSLGQCL